MEYFGSRLIWTDIEEVIDPELGDTLNDEDTSSNEPNSNNVQPSTSRATSNLPNEIQYAD